MKSSRLNEWLQLLASLGVLVGLIFVSYEIKQNTAVADAEHLREIYSSWMHISTVEIETDIGEIFIKSIANPESLTPRDLFKLNAYYILVTSTYDNMAGAGELGIGKGYGIAESDVRYYFSSEFSRQWFEANKHWLHPDNAEIISRVIQTTPVSRKWETVEGMLLKKNQ